MPTTTIYANKDTRIAHRVSDGWDAGAGSSDYLPVGLYQGYKYRSLIGFSYSFTGWTAITSATLHLTTSPQFYVAFSTDPDVEIRRITEGWSEGSADSLSSSNATTWANQPSTTATNSVTKDVTTSEGADVSIDITDMMVDALNAGVFYGIKIEAVDEGNGVDVTEFVAREHSSADRAHIVITYSTNSAPDAPQLPYPTGGLVLNTLLPTLTASFSDPDSGDTMSGYQIQVSTDSSFSSVTHWDVTTSTSGALSFGKQYASAVPLVEGTTYYWRSRTKDAAGLWGPWDFANAFKVNSIPTAPSVSLGQSPTTDVKTLTPSFNITHNDADPNDSKMYKYEVVLETSGGSAVWDSGQVSLGTPVNTKSVSYTGPALSWQTGYRWKARTQDRNGAWSPYSAYAVFTTHTTAVPTSLNPSGGEAASSTTPTLVGSRGSSNDSLVSAQIEVYASDGTTLIWSSGTFTSGVSSTGFSKQVGTTLTAATTYKWRARVTGSIGGTSAWSALQTFTTPDTTTPAITGPVGSGITDLTPDFVFNRSVSFNRHELFLYSQDDNFATAIWSNTPTTYTATTSKTVTSGVTLDYGKTYKWKVRVSADGGVNWSPFTGLISFTTDIAGIPTLTAPIDDSWETSLTPTFTGTTFNSETISTYRIIVYASDQETVIWDSGNLSGSGTSFSKVYAGATALVRGNSYFWQASYTKTGGIPGGFSPLESFHVNADPSAPTGLSPSSGFVYADDASPVAPTFTASFADLDKTAWGDSPTKMEVEVQRNSDGVQMYVLSKTTNLTGDSNSMTDGDADVTKTTGSGGANLTTEVEYKWRARFTDSKSAVGSWSGWNVFKPSMAPTLTQTSPTAPSATINSPSFTVSWTFSGSGGKAQETFRIRIKDNTTQVVVFDTGYIVSSATSYTVPAGYLQNGNTYSILLDATDTDSLDATEQVNTVTTSWTAPDAPANFSASGDVEGSSIALTWDETALSESDFSYYQIYRRQPGDADWTAYATIANKTTTSYTDYLAAHGVLYDYYLTVFQKVPGDVDLESVASDVSSAILDSDTWFVIGADRSPNHIFELPVSDAPFKEVVQQEVFEPLGTRRKSIVRGKVLGAEGTLSLTYKDTEVEAAKSQLAYIRDNEGPHVLKSPFGDIWLAEFSGPDKGYTGGGHMKVTLAWTEVDE